jgi:hypothetical protein
MVKRCWVVVMSASAALMACGYDSAAGGGLRTMTPTPVRPVQIAVGSGAGERVTSGTGIRMCAALTAADLIAVGLKPENEQPNAVPGDPPNEGAYCLFSKASASQGGIEFDIFYPADHSIYETVVNEGSTRQGKPSRLPGVDESYLDEPGSTPSITVRRGTLVFSISVPGGPRAHDQLIKLAATVLHRT